MDLSAVGKTTQISKEKDTHHLETLTPKPFNFLPEVVFANLLIQILIVV